MTRNRESALKEIQELGFRMYDIALFLDTHPHEACAISEYTATLSKYNAMVKNFEKLYGPLTIGSIGDCASEWDWTKGPWPWEVSENEEVCR